MLLASTSNALLHELPRLPYAMDALEPYLSRETLAYHYGKHHRGYVNRLNELVRETEFEDAPLEEIVRRSSGALFNNAAQLWNHNFYWQCMKPHGGGIPAGAWGVAANGETGPAARSPATYSSAQFWASSQSRCSTITRTRISRRTMITAL